MVLLRPLCLLLRFVLFSFLLFGTLAAAEVGRGTEAPAWCRRLDFDFAAVGKEPVTPKAGGVEYIVIQQEVNLKEQETSFHNVFRICSEAGLSRYSTLVITFDPSFEKLDIHRVRIWREGQERDALAEMKIELIQQEKDLERNMYNGRVSAIGVMRDLRVGDIVETWSTRKGFNPVFKGNYSDFLYCNWAVSVRRQSIRILHPSSLILHRSEQGKSGMVYSRSTENGVSEHVWTGVNLPPVAADPDTPAWYQPFSYVEVTETPALGWHTVAVWASELFKPVEAGAELKKMDFTLAKKAREAAEGKSLTEEETAFFGKGEVWNLPQQLAEALAVLDFVQKDVRYMGIEMGPYSHQPNDPNEVLSRRYGDCKDKVRLLCALLELRGIKAYPVLVNTALGEKLEGHQPNPLMFNHVIARIDLAGKSIYVDATNPYQEGSLLGRNIEKRTCGLVVRPETEALSAVPGRLSAKSHVQVREEIEMPDYQSAATVKVRFEYRGSMAEWARSYLRSASPEESGKNYFGFYREAFPQLESLGALTWRDDAAQNLLTLDMAFRAPELWSFRKGSKTVREAAFWPLSMRNYFQQPNSLERTSPLALRHPVILEHETVLHLPDEFTLDPINYHQETESFSFQSTGRSDGKRVVLTNLWVSKQDHVSLEKLRDHVSALADIRANVGITLTKDPEAAKRLASGGVAWRLVAVSLFSILGSIALCRLFLSRWAPMPLVLESTFSPQLGGWLFLPALGLVVSCIVQLVNLGSQVPTIYDWSVWQKLTSPESSAYLPGWGYAVAWENMLNLLVLCWLFFTCGLFFRRRSAAPLAFIVLLGLALVVALSELLLSQMVLDGGKAMNGAAAVNLFRSMIGAAIWIPYFMKSKRVKNTFVR